MSQHTYIVWTQRLDQNEPVAFMPFRSTRSHIKQAAECLQSCTCYSQLALKCGLAENTWNLRIHCDALRQESFCNYIFACMSLHMYTPYISCKVYIQIYCGILWICNLLNLLLVFWSSTSSLSETCLGFSDRAFSPRNLNCTGIAAAPPAAHGHLIILPSKGREAML